MVKLRKLMFVLPNLFTITSIFCGFYALVLTTGEATPAHLYQAALAIFFAMFFDGFDGRVARLTKTQSKFGVELDSLADVVSFGVVPAMLVYKWALAPLGFLGIFIAFSYAACGALRLARFNVLAWTESHGGASGFFVGLPIPIAALGIVSMVLAHYAVTGGAPVSATAQVPIAAAVLLLALLMVSTVAYRTFKHVRPTPLALGSVGGLFAALAAGYFFANLHPVFMLAILFAAYVTMGLVESALQLARRLGRARVGAGAGAGAAGMLAEGPEEEEEEEEEVEQEDYL